MPPAPTVPFGVRVLLAVLGVLLTAAGAARSAPAPVPATVTILDQPLHAGRIRPGLFGNFIELLDDLVPGMRAEMLNDRGFEGVLPRSNWCYFDSEPNFCDRTWGFDHAQYRTDGAFNGTRCVELSGSASHGAAISQGGLAVRRGAAYLFTGHFRSDVATHVRIELSAPLSGGGRTRLAAADVAVPGGGWQLATARLTCSAESRDVTATISARKSVCADQLSLMPEENRDGWRTDVVEAIRAAHPAVIRWGGSVVDPGGYQWKHGIGPRDERAPFHNEVWGRIDTNEVGIDEFCRFCELVGAQPLICVSRRDGARSAADLVEYCNGGSDTAWGARRAANGHREPYHIRYWQLGNEVSSEDEASIRGVLEACHAIHVVDPKAQILTSYPSAPLIHAAAREIAFVAPHHYTRDLGACDAELRRLSDLMRASPETEHIRCAITEWNVTGGEWGLERGRQLSLDTAIRNARYLHLLMRHSDFVEIGCRSNMCNSLCSGIIATRAGELLRRPSFHVMKLYSDHALPVPLAVSGAPNGIDVVACASDDRHHACVFAVNTRSEPVPLALEVAGASSHPAPTAESVCDTLDLRQPDAINNWARPDRVRTMPLAVNGNQVVLPALSVSAISF